MKSETQASLMSRNSITVNDTISIYEITFSASKKHRTILYYQVTTALYFCFTSKKIISLKLVSLPKQPKMFSKTEMAIRHMQ